MRNINWQRAAEVAACLFRGDVLEIEISRQILVRLRFDKFTPYGQAFPFGAAPGEWRRINLPLAAVLSAAYSPKGLWAVRLVAALGIERAKE